jgi:hypothetical protein
MKRKFSPPGFVLFLALLALIVVNGCWSNNNSSQINQSGDLANKASPTAPDKTASPEKSPDGYERDSRRSHDSLGAERCFPETAGSAGLRAHPSKHRVSNR